MHGHASSALTLWALGICLRPHAVGLQFELGDVLVDDHEALFGQHQAIGQAQPIDLSLSAR